MFRVWFHFLANTADENVNTSLTALPSDRFDVVGDKVTGDDLAAVFDQQTQKLEFSAGEGEQFPLFVDTVFIDTEHLTACLDGFAVDTA
jgi:hypothetical protein